MPPAPEFTPKPNPRRAKPVAPRYELVDVTPAIAELWLATYNLANRTPREARVATYARDMAAGRWTFTTQGISFGTDGRLLDGQHRLMAVVQAGVTVRMLVWHGVPLDAVFDTGTARSLADVLHLTPLQAAVTLAMMRGPSPSKPPATMIERQAFYAQHGDTIHGVINAFPGQRRGITQASVLGAIARSWLHLPTPTIARFCEVLWTGVPDLVEAPRERTVVHLRDRLLMIKNPPPFALAGMTLHALHAFAEGRVLVRLTPVTPDNDPFPLPVAPEVAS
jgi:hypothetical protein